MQNRFFEKMAHYKRLTTLLRHLADISAFIGLAIFVGGGLYFRDHFNGNIIVFRISEFGFYFIPMALMGLFAPEELRKTKIHRIATAAYRKLLALDRREQRITLAIALGTLFLFHLAGVIQKHLSFRTESDLAIYANACANYLFSSFKGDQTLLADHFEPMLILFSPLCSRLDPAITLLTIQTIFWLIGAIGIYRLARDHRWSFPTALAMSALYMLFTGNVTTMYYDFHLIALAIGVIPWLIWAWKRDYHAVFFVIAIFYVGLKENTSLTLAGLGILLLFERKYIRGSILAIAAPAAFVAIMLVVFPWATGGDGTFYFGKYYNHIGTDFGGFVHTFLTRPFFVISSALSVQKILYLFCIFIPFAFVHFLRPSYILPIVPALALNVLSCIYTTYSRDFHYEAEIFPYLFATAIIIAKDRRAVMRWNALRHRLSHLTGARSRSFVPGPRALVLLVLFLFFSGQTPAFHFKANRPEKFHAHLKTNLRELVKPTDRVAAIEKVVSHLSHVRHVYFLDEWKRAEKIVIAYPHFRLWKFSHEEIEHRIIPEIEKEYTISYKDPKYSLFRIYIRKQKSPAGR